MEMGGVRLGSCVYANALGRGKSVEKNEIRTSHCGQWWISVVSWRSVSVRTFFKNDYIAKDLNVYCSLFNVDEAS